MPKDSDEVRRAKRRAVHRRYYAKNKAKILANRKQWLAQPGVRARLAELARTKYRRWKPDDIYHKNWVRRRDDKYLAAGRPRPDACDICGSTKDRIVFDHDHKRGHFRGWICHRCNVVLGQVEDDAGLLTKLIAYLHRTQTDTSPQFSLPGI